MEKSDPMNTLFSLPEEVKKFAKLQDLLNSNIQRNEKILATVQKRVSVAQKEVDKGFREISCVNRKLSLIEDETAHTEDKNAVLQDELEKMLGEIEEMKHRINEMQKVKEIEELNFKLMREKMEKHKENAKMIQSKRGKFVELSACRSNISSLKKQKFEYERKGQLKNEKVEEIKDLKDKITQWTKQRDEILNEIENKRKQIEGCETKGQQIQNEITVLHKRNSAQLRRLKRRLQEVQTKNNYKATL